MVFLSFNNINDYSSILMWIRVITQFLGFTLLSFSYFIVGKYQGANRNNYLITILGTLLLFLIAFGVFLLVSPLELLSVYSFSSIFTIFNLFLLSYITIFLSRKIKHTKKLFEKAPPALFAFFSLWIGQLAFLIYSEAINDTPIFDRLANCTNHRFCALHPNLLFGKKGVVR